MRSRDFSPDAHYFKYIVKRYSWLALISFIVMGAHTVFDSVLACRPGVSHGLYEGHFTLVGTCTDAAKTIFYASAFVAIFFAFVLFSFLWKKKEAYSTLSLGVSLKNQFLMRYLFGGGLLLLTYVMLFFASYAINITRLGADDFGLATAYAFNYTLMFCAVALALYTLAVLTAILTGRFIESAFSIIVLLLAPYTLGISLHYLFANFLHGASFAHSADESSIMIWETGKRVFVSVMDYAERTGAFYPFEDFFNIGGIPVTRPDNYFINSWYQAQIEDIRAEIALPVLGLILTLAVTVLIATATYFCFIRRRAEYSGKAAIYPAFYCTVGIIASLSAALPVYLLRLNRFALLALYCAVFAVVFFILTAFFNSSIKRTFCRYKTAIASVGALCLVALICNLGGLGYSEKVPEAEEVEQVIMEYIGNPVIYHGTNGGSYYTASNFVIRDKNGNPVYYDDRLDSVQAVHQLDWYVNLNSVPRITDPEDIQKAIDIHKFVIEDGIKTIGDCKHDTSDPSATPYEADWHIVYVLKNGKTIERYYEFISLAATEKIFSIEDSDTYREFYLSARIPAEGEEKLTNEFELENQVFEAADEFFSDVTVLDMLSVDDKYELLEALSLDFADLSFEERYFSDDKTIGTVRLGKWLDTESGRMLSTRLNRPEDQGCNVWYVTEKYVRTLDFFEKHGLLGVFDGDITIEKVEIQEFDPYYISAINPKGRGTLLTIQSYDYTIHTLKNLPVIEVPEAEWDSYVSRSRAIASTTRGGILVRITYTSRNGLEKVIDRLIPNE